MGGLEMSKARKALDDLAEATNFAAGGPDEYTYEVRSVFVVRRRAGEVISDNAPQAFAEAFLRAVKARYEELRDEALRLMEGDAHEALAESRRELDEIARELAKEST
jgi:hypothetical protein